MLLTSMGASACQPPEAKPPRQQIEEAIGVVRAKVMAAKVINIEDLGETCDAINCDVLEVTLDISETFKGNAERYETIYAPIATMCVLPLMPGWEYVLFLEKNKGMIVPNDYSFPSQGKEYKQRLAKLRRMAAE